MKWIKIIILCCMGFIISCTKMEIEPIPPSTTENIFSVKESRVTDGQIIHFKLPTSGIYTLTLIDKETGQVISRERFNGDVGENVKSIYTNSIQSQYLYLLLEDVTKTEIAKTTIITK
jgi:hypothetical protein